MAYSHNLIRKGIKRRDARMCKKGGEDAQISGNNELITVQQAVGSLAVQG